MSNECDLKKHRSPKESCLYYRGCSTDACCALLRLFARAQQWASPIHCMPTEIPQPLHDDNLSLMNAIYAPSIARRHSSPAECDKEQLKHCYKSSVTKYIDKKQTQPCTKTQASVRVIATENCDDLHRKDKTEPFPKSIWWPPKHIIHFESITKVRFRKYNKS